MSDRSLEVVTLHEEAMADEEKLADLAEQLAHTHMINAYENMVANGLKELCEEGTK